MVTFIIVNNCVLVFRASGEITRAAIRDFEALSLDGKLQVEIMNTGYVTASFHVSHFLVYTCERKFLESQVIKNTIKIGLSRSLFLPLCRMFQQVRCSDADCGFYF